jgi:uncharacterized circularly permuted ATP-grasp superfamily protein/uncharacterized alpha-E superfamily protein
MPVPSGSGGSNPSGPIPAPSTAAPAAPPPSWYLPDAGGYDETYAADGRVRAHWEHVARSLAELGHAELWRRHEQAQRLLRENGVLYHVYDDPRGLHRVWELDPIPLVIDSQEWSLVESALIQRAELMNLILADLYGARELLRKGLLPPELVLAHAGFLRPCDQVRLRGQHQLILYSVNLARAPDGRLWVVGDRTQAPSGAGYALENRMVTLRILPSLFRDSQVHRLAVFFRALRQTLAGLSPRGRGEPRVVVLSPGPHNETYFEHAYLAGYLGYSLVQGSDLVAANGRVWLKTLAERQPVDVILRRVDDDWCDPLELRPESQLGVTGLLDCVRRGTVAVVNPLGSGLLENPALLAFLPGIARHFLGQALRLPSVATWWCGQPRERDHVLANLERLVIKPVHRGPGLQTWIGPELGAAQLRELRDRILARPHLHVGQELVSFSSAPALAAGGVVARKTVLRTFLVARDSDYAVMPGGLARMAPPGGGILVSNQAGGASKDIWVLASEPEQQVTLWIQPAREPIAPRAGPGALPSRTADNLYWLGRYAERAEGTVRLLRVVLARRDESLQYDDPAHLACLHTLLRSLTHVTATYPGYVHADAALLDAPEQELVALACDAQRAGSVAYALRAMLDAAHAIRDFWSGDTWRVLDAADRQLQGLARVARLDDLAAPLDEVIVALGALTGLTGEQVNRDHAWRFLDLGRRIERAQLLVSLLRAALVPRQDAATEALLIESVLSGADSLLGYRQRYRSYLELRSMLELMLLDPGNPRGLGWQLGQIQQTLAALPGESHGSVLPEKDRLALEALTLLRLADLDALLAPAGGSAVRGELDQLLARIGHLLARTSGCVTDAYFGHVREAQQLSMAVVSQ